MGIGISLYFEMLKTLGWSLLAMFIFGLPSLIITFLSDPNIFSEASRGSDPLGVLRYRAFSLCVRWLFMRPTISQRICFQSRVADTGLDVFQVDTVFVD
jgi:hypothetical protein